MICDGCLWNEQCGTGTDDKCEHFTPTEINICELIKTNRTEFLEQWEQYESEYN